MIQPGTLCYWKPAVASGDQCVVEVLERVDPSHPSTWRYRRYRVRSVTENKLEWPEWSCYEYLLRPLSALEALAATGVE